MGKTIDLTHWQAAGEDWWRGARQKQGFYLSKLLDRLPEVDSFYLPDEDYQMVLLPGVWEPWGVLLHWAQVLWQKGWSVSFVPQLDLMVGEIPDLTQTLVDTLLTRFADRPFVIGAHSKGGLVGKAAMQGGQLEIAGLIACGTPFFGAPIARLTPPPAQLRNLTPENAYLELLRSDWETNTRTAFVEAHWDQNVPQIGSLPGAFHVQVRTIGHNALLESDEAATAIDRFGKYFLEKTRG